MTCCVFGSHAFSTRLFMRRNHLRELAYPARSILRHYHIHLRVLHIKFLLAVYRRQYSSRDVGQVLRVMNLCLSTRRHVVPTLPLARWPHLSGVDFTKRVYSNIILQAFRTRTFRQRWQPITRMDTIKIGPHGCVTISFAESQSQHTPPRRI